MCDTEAHFRVNPLASSHSSADNRNSWDGDSSNCETTYEWEVVTSPGLEPQTYSSQTINPCADTKCTGTGDARACNGILADITGLPGGRIGSPGSKMSGGCLLIQFAQSVCSLHSCPDHRWPLPGVCPGLQPVWRHSLPHFQCGDGGRLQHPAAGVDPD